MFHFRDGGFLQFVFYGVMGDPGPLDVLPHVLNRHLDLPGDSLVQKLQQFLARHGLPPFRVDLYFYL
jgi:hypothetical protein